MAVSGPGPVGRYGHAVTMVGSKFFVFGGQVDGEFLNDLWAFDLNSRACPTSPLLSSRRASVDAIAVKTKATWELYEPPPNTEKPGRRTGHVCVTHGDKLIMCASFALSLLASFRA